MRALYYTEFGAADRLQYGQLATPQPGRGEVLVKVAGCGVNPIDVKTRAGKGFVAVGLGSDFCFIPGYDLSGTLVTAAANLPAGTPVIGMAGFPARAGASAEYCVAPAKDLAAAPRSMPLVDAAGLPLAGLTAWQGLFQHGKVQAGQRVLVLAGAGGVGHLAVQLAQWAGAEVGATASAANLPFLAGLGARYGLDYHDPAALAGSGQWDLILDLVGGDSGRAALAQLAPDGLMLTVPTITAAELIAAGIEQGKQVQGYTVQPDSQQLQQLVELVDTGRLHLSISQRVPLAQGAEAHRLLESGRTRGKVVLVI